LQLTNKERVIKNAEYITEDDINNFLNILNDCLNSYHMRDNKSENENENKSERESKNESENESKNESESESEDKIKNEQYNILIIFALTRVTDIKINS
jgi:hypothetical protein